jgi:hypothetical protein
MEKYRMSQHWEMLFFSLAPIFSNNTTWKGYNRNAIFLV